MSLEAYVVSPDSIKVTINDKPTLPLNLSANPAGADGLPVGLVALDGVVYNALPDRLPALLVYKDGGAEIRKSYSVVQIAEARFIISGSAVLIQDGQTIDVESHLAIKPNEQLRRVGLGIRTNGELVIVVSKCTVEELQLALLYLGSEEGIMLEYQNAYLNYPEGGIKLGTRPVTCLEALNVKELPRPLVVIDPGHGGVDPGAVGFGLQEKDLNLRGARVVQAVLTTKYEGTFLLTHNGSTMDLGERTKVENALKPDLFISLHSNAGGGTGFESYTCNGCSKMAETYQEVIHRVVYNYMAPWGVRDRGKKKANFWVLKHTVAPAVLLESLFVDTLKDAELLKNGEWLDGAYTAVADGIARALSLKKLPPPKEEPVEQPKELYRVQVGAFRYRKGAETLLEQLKKAGFDGFIKRE